MAKARCLSLLDKSISAALSAIELYNKPNFNYREESFSILIINAWELLLKAKVLKDNNNKLTSLYVPYYPQKKNGDKSKKKRYKSTRSGNNMTSSIIELIKREIGDDNLKTNLEDLIEIRDNSIHFMNHSKAFEKDFLESALAALKNYSKAMYEWFGKSLENYDLMMIPLAFNAPKAFDVEALRKESKEHKNLLSYMHKRKLQVNTNSEYAVSVIVDVKLKKNQTGDVSVSFDKQGKPIFVDSEEVFMNKYPMTYYDLIEKMKKRYADFVLNPKFHSIRKPLCEDEKYHKKRYLDYVKQSGTAKSYYSMEILKEFDKYYIKGKK